MPANFLDISNKTNRFRKGFMNGDPFDEPTYLTFAIDFDFTGEMIDPFTNMTASPLFNETDNIASAKKFLEKNDYSANANCIPAMKKLLQSITDETPWYLQSIDGVGDLWNIATRMGPKLKSGAVVSINTLESLDLRILTIANLYRKLAYDQRNIRYRLPDNLRWFTMDIYLAEVRNFREILETGITTFGLKKNNDAGNRLVNDVKYPIKKDDPATVNPNAQISISNALDHFGYLRYRCYQCEFDFSDSLRARDGSGFTVYTPDKPFTSSFKIKIGYFEEAHALKEQFIGGGNSLDLLGIANDLGPFANVAKNALLRGEGALDKILSVPTQLINTGISELQKLAENGSLGNIYNQPPLFNNTTPLFNFGPQPTKVKRDPSNLGGDVYNTTKLPDGPDGLGKIYEIPEIPDGPTDLGDNYPGLPIPGGPTEIGDVYQTGQIADGPASIGDVYQDGSIPDGPNSIGDVYQTGQIADGPASIGDVYPNDQILDGPNTLGDVYPDNQIPDGPEVIDDVYPNDPISNGPGSLGSVYSDDQLPNGPSELGDVYPDVTRMNGPETLGDTYPTEQLPNGPKVLGDVYTEDPIQRGPSELGDTYPNRVSDNGPEDLGNIYQD